MSRKLSDLCTLLVRHAYGDLPAEIFSILSVKDRLRVPDIGHHLKLSTKAVKHGLALLAQQNLVLFYPSDAGPTFYQADLAHAYSILRFGKHVQAIDDFLGPPAAAVLSSVQFLGNATRSELAATGVSDAPAGIANGEVPPKPLVNGYHDVKAKPNGDAMSAPVEQTGKPITSDSHDNTGPQKRPRSPPQDAADLNSDPETSSPAVAPVRNLRRLGYLEELQEYTFMPPTDLELIVETHVRRIDARFKDSINGPKKSADFRQAVKEYKQSILDGREAIPRLDSDSSNEEDAAPAKKKRKVNGVGSVAVTPEPTRFRLNLERVLLSLRTKILSDFVRVKIGDSFAKVYRSFLRVIERKTELSGQPFSLVAPKRPRYKAKTAAPDGVDSGEETYDRDRDDGDDTDLVEKYGSARTTEIADGLDAEDRKALAKDMDYVYSEQRGRRDERRKSSEPPDERIGKTGRRVNGEAKKGTGGGRNDRQKLLGNVERALRIITSSPCKFMVEAGPHGSNEWAVNLGQLLRTFVQEEMEKVVEARFGAAGRRVVRILHSKGKLDEKTISAVGLMKQRDLRAILTQLQSARYVEIQEVPRDATRQPSRTVYLWYFDQERCRDAMLEDTYKTMARLLQRHEVEQDKVRALLEKASRTDVQGNEEQFLNAMEREALKGWRNREEAIFLAMHRSDDLVLLLRDFLAPPLANPPQQ